MRITGDMRKLLGQYELLGGRFRERFDHDSSPPGMLMPTQRTNRPIDSPATQIAKGMLAAAAHVRQKSKGVSRTEAASWVLRTTTS